jgi:hypothetical protein
MMVLCTASCLLLYMAYGGDRMHALMPDFTLQVCHKPQKLHELSWAPKSKNI